MSQLRRSGGGIRLALVVSCTGTKTVPVSPQLRVASLGHGRDRARRWQERRAAALPGPALRHLYAGPQWSASLSLEQHAVTVGYDVDLWVVSAGLGLVPASTSAPAYAASFTSGPDEVAPSRTGRRLWWKELTEHAHGFDHLQRQYEHVLVVLSPSYLSVVEEDLQPLQDAEKAAVVSSCSRNLVYSSAGLRRALGASAMTLNARAAAQLLDLAKGDLLGSATVRERWRDWAHAHAGSPTPSRRVTSDDEVLTFIQAGLRRPRASRTALLTDFRAQGMACEQSRFQRLYEAVLRSSP